MFAPLLLAAGLPIICPPAGEDTAFGLQLFIDHPILLSPSVEEENAHTNANLFLGGQIARLNLEEPTWRVRLMDPGGNDVELFRDGRRITHGGLQPDTWYTFVAEPTEAHGCPGCVTPWQTSFRTGAGPREQAPGVVLPELTLLRDDCSGGARLSAVVELPEGVALVDIAASTNGTDATLIGRPILGHAAAEGERVELTAAMDGVGQGDEVRVAFTFEDLAGNTSHAVVGRVQVGSRVVDSPAAPLMCAQPEQLEVARADLLPANGDIVARFPFVPRPVELIDLGDAGAAPIGLYPAETFGATQRLRPASSLTPGATYALRPLPCPGCACRGCDMLAEARIRVIDEDHTPPSPPQIEDMLRVLESEPQRGGACFHDQPALIVQVAVPPEPDVIAYRGLIREPSRPGILLEPLASFVDDGNVREIRFDLVGQPTVAVDAFELQLTAIDAAGNEQTSALSRGASGPTSCAAVHPSGPSRRWGAALLVGLLGVLRRPRRLERPPPR